MKRLTYAVLATAVLLGLVLGTGCSTKKYPNVWSLRADSSSVSLVNNFWDVQRNYLDYNSAGDTTFHYWPQAHGLDIITDWYIRTHDEKILKIYDNWFEGVPKANHGGWWNEFYDDMEWHAIATCRAYEATGQQRFLDASKELWDYIKVGWNDRGEGGVTWKKGMEWSKNACSNGPAAITAAKLYRVLGRPEDLKWAKDIYAWEKKALFEPSGAIWDSVNGDTGKLSKFCLTYNQGTFVGAAVELYRLTGDKTYIDDAIKATDYTLTDLSVDSPQGKILQNEGARDGGIFKGIFVRYFTDLILYGDLPAQKRDAYVNFLRINGEVLWNEGNNDYRFGPDWREKPGTPSAMTPQLSGCMLVEALAVLERNGLLND